MRFILALIIAVPLLMADSAWADFDDGLAAYNRGDYATAMREWELAANRKEALALFSMAILYYTGKGVPRNLRNYAKFMKLAAMQGDPYAAQSVGLLYEVGSENIEDFPFLRNFQTAIDWYELSIRYFSEGTSPWPQEVSNFMLQKGKENGRIHDSDYLIKKVEALKRRVDSDERALQRRIDRERQEKEREARKYVGNGSCHDISGVWDAIYKDADQSAVKDRVTIFVEGSEFSGTMKIGVESVGGGQRTIKGRIQSGSISEVVFLEGTGDSGGRHYLLKEIVIENYCNKISFNVYNGNNLTLTRDAPTPKTKVETSSATKGSDKQKEEGKTKLSPETQSIKSKLKGLKDMLDEGLITEEEAAAKRAKLLDDY